MRRTNDYQGSDWQARNITQPKRVTQVARLTHITKGIKTLKYRKENSSTTILNDSTAKGIRDYSTL